MDGRRVFRSHAERLQAARSGEFATWAVPNEDLTLDRLPDPANWSDVAAFALSYDGYALWNDVGALANATRDAWDHHDALPADLDALRGCLFFEQRRLRHFDSAPEGDDLHYFGALLDGIRSAVAER